MTTNQHKSAPSSPLQPLRRLAGSIKAQGSFGVAIAVALLIVGGFVIYPTIRIIARSLGVKGLEQWTELLSSGTTLSVLRNTVVLGVLSGLLGTFAGLVMALVQVRTKFRFKRTLHIISLLPVISPPFAVSMSILSLFGRSGLISKDLFGVRYDISGLDGLLLALSISFMPVAYLNFVGMLQSFDGALEEAANDLGGSLVHRFRTIVIPLLAPGIANSFLLIFVSAIADLGNPIVLGGSNFEVLSTGIYLAIVGEFNQPKAAVFSVMLLLPSLLIFAAQYFWLNKKQYVTITGKPVGTPKPVEQRNVLIPLYTIALVITAAIVMIYGYIVVGAFTQVWNIDFTPTLENFIGAMNGASREAMLDTLKLAAISTPLAAFSGLVIAFVITQREFKGRGLLDFASVLGVAVPGIIIGVGLLLAYNAPLFGGLIPKLQGTATILVLAFTVRALPGVVRVAVGALNQLSKNLEEASISLGATPAQTFRKIILPLIRPALFSSLIWSFARSMTSLSPIILLVTPEWRIFTERILNDAQQGRYGDAAAKSMVLVTVILIAIGFLSLVTGFKVSNDDSSFAK